MTFAKFSLSYYARCVFEPSSDVSGTSQYIPNVQEKWTKTDGSAVDKDLNVIYDSDENNVKVIYRSEQKDLLELSRAQMKFKIFVHKRNAMVFVVNCDMYRQFKMQFVDEKTANDFHNLLKTKIPIIAVNDTNIDMINVAGITQISENESSTEKEQTFAASQPIPLSQTNSIFTANPGNDGSCGVIDDDFLFQTMQECLSDPTFPAFMERVRNAVPQIMKIN